MLNGVKKSLVTGLSVALSVSLSCGMCTCAYSIADYKQMLQEYQSCRNEEIRCTSICKNAKDGKADETPVDCGGDTIKCGRRLVFPGCEERSSECKEKIFDKLSDTEKCEMWRTLVLYEGDDFGVSDDCFTHFLDDILEYRMDSDGFKCVNTFYKVVFSLNRVNALLNLAVTVALPIAAVFAYAGGYWNEWIAGVARYEIL